MSATTIVPSNDDVMIVRAVYDRRGGDRKATRDEMLKTGWDARTVDAALDVIEKPVNGHSTKSDLETVARIESQSAPVVTEVNVEPVNPILQAALRCVEKGWYVFALEERGKRPDSELSPHGFNSSTNDANAVRAVWAKKPNANYGIDLGRSNLTVLDFDAGMPAGLQLPNTLQVSTSRGVHVYFHGVSKQGDLYVNGAHVGEIKSAGGYVLGRVLARVTIPRN